MSLINNVKVTPSSADVSVKTDNYVKEAGISFNNILNNVLGADTKVKSRENYVSTSYDGATEEYFTEFMKGGMSLNKSYAKSKYHKLMEEAEEFERLLRKLLSEAQANNKAAKDALNLIDSFVQELKKEGKSAEEIISQTLSKINSHISEFNKNVAINGFKEFSKEQILVVNLLSSTMGYNLNSVDGVKNNLEKYKIFKSQTEEQNLGDILLNTVKQKKRLSTERSTKTYLRKKKYEETLNDKLQEIVKFRNNSDQVSAKDRIDKIVEEISTLDSGEPLQSHITDINRLNKDLYSPVFI